jgi:transposase
LISTDFVEVVMSLRPNFIGEIPAETVRVAHAAFPKCTVITRLRDEFRELYRDEDFETLYPRRGQPALVPWRLALVTVFQFLEHLSDRQAAECRTFAYRLGICAEPGVG